MLVTVKDLHEVLSTSEPPTSFRSMLASIEMMNVMITQATLRRLLESKDRAVLSEESRELVPFEWPGLGLEAGIVQAEV